MTIYFLKRNCRAIFQQEIRCKYVPKSNHLRAPSLLGFDNSAFVQLINNLKWGPRIKTWDPRTLSKHFTLFRIQDLESLKRLPITYSDMLWRRQNGSDKQQLLLICTQDYDAGRCKYSNMKYSLRSQKSSYKGWNLNIKKLHF